MCLSLSVKKSIGNQSVWSLSKEGDGIVIISEGAVMVLKHHWVSKRQWASSCMWSCPSCPRFVYGGPCFVHISPRFVHVLSTLSTLVHILSMLVHIWTWTNDFHILSTLFHSHFCSDQSEQWSSVEQHSCLHTSACLNEQFHMKATMHDLNGQIHVWTFDIDVSSLDTNQQTMWPKLQRIASNDEIIAAHSDKQEVHVMNLIQPTQVWQTTKMDQSCLRIQEKLTFLSDCLETVNKNSSGQVLPLIPDNNTVDWDKSSIETNDKSAAHSTGTNHQSEGESSSSSEESQPKVTSSNKFEQRLHTVPKGRIVQHCPKKVTHSIHPPSVENGTALSLDDFLKISNLKVTDLSLKAQAKMKRQLTSSRTEGSPSVKKTSKGN